MDGGRDPGGRASYAPIDLRDKARTAILVTPGLIGKHWEGGEAVPWPSIFTGGTAESREVRL